MIELMRSWLKRYFSNPQVVILGLLLFLGFVLIFMLGDMLTPVFASLVIAYLLDGMVSALHRFRIPRLVSLVAVFVLFMACLLVLTIGLLPMLSRQIGQLLQQLPSMLSRGQKELMLLPQRYPDFVSEAQIRQILDLFGSELTHLGQRILTVSVASVRGLISLLVYLILVPLMVFFFLKDKVTILEWVTGFLPEHRGLAAEVWKEVNQQIINYVRGKLWEILIVWAVSYAAFKMLGLQFTMLVALLIGLSVIVPYLGATVMIFPVALIAYFQWGWGSQFAYALILYGVIQVLDGNLLAPLLLSEVVNLHPVAIIVAVLVFGGLWGLWGLFFAVPLATLVHAVVKAWFSEQVKRKADTGS